MVPLIYALAFHHIVIGNVMIDDNVVFYQVNGQSYGGYFILGDCYEDACRMREHN